MTVRLLRTDFSVKRITEIPPKKHISVFNDKHQSIKYPLFDFHLYRCAIFLCSAPRNSLHIISCFHGSQLGLCKPQLRLQATFATLPSLFSFHIGCHEVPWTGIHIPHIAPSYSLVPVSPSVLPAFFPHTCVNSFVTLDHYTIFIVCLFPISIFLWRSHTLSFFLMQR